MMSSICNDTDDSVELGKSKSSDYLSFSLKMKMKKNSCPPNICNGKLIKPADEEFYIRFRSNIFYCKIIINNFDS